MKNLIIGLLAMSTIPAFAGLNAAPEDIAQLVVVTETVESCLEERDEAVNTLRAANRIIILQTACTNHYSQNKTKQKAVIQVFK